jgi:hypothetical protein
VKQAINKLGAFYKKVILKWLIQQSKTLVRLFLLLLLNSVSVSWDIAVIDINPFKIDTSNFDKNIISLDTEMNLADFIIRIYPNIHIHTHFKFIDHLLRLHNTISVNKICFLQMVDQENEKCFMVLSLRMAAGLAGPLATPAASFIHSLLFWNSPSIIF